MKTAHNRSMVSPAPQGGRPTWATARIAFPMLALLAGAIGLVRWIAIQGGRPARAHESGNMARLEANVRLGTEGGIKTGSLGEILAHPELIPTHNHPLLGRQAPDFKLDDSDGQAWSLRDLLAGGPVVLIFYHTYCDLCDRQLFTDKNDLPLFREVGARVVAISADPPEVTRRRFERFGLFGFPVLSDPGNKVAQAYQVFRREQDGTPADHLLHGTFVIDRHGTVQWVNVGDAPFRSNPALLYVLAKIQGRLPSAVPVQ
jgi:peroxiredoxin